MSEPRCGGRSGTVTPAADASGAASATFDQRRSGPRTRVPHTDHRRLYRGAIAEIAGCFAFWPWLRLHQSIWWVLPGLVSLALFAALLTLVDGAFAGRTYGA